MSDVARYTLPTGIVGLTGAVKKPAPGTLPLRGDLAHIALAEQFLAAHYVIPMVRTVGAAPANLLMMPRYDAQLIMHLDPGTEIEALDYSGPWCWACLGPDGPSGYVPTAALAPETD